MPTDKRPSNTPLVAILLVLNSSRGHRPVFCFPPEPETYVVPRQTDGGTSLKRIGSRTGITATRTPRRQSKRGVGGFGGSFGTERDEEVGDGSLSSELYGTLSPDTGLEGNDESPREGERRRLDSDVLGDPYEALPLNPSPVGVPIPKGLSRTPPITYRPRLSTSQAKSPLTPSLQSAKPDTLFGYDPFTLADILTPKPAATNRRFQMAIDDLVFLGHPTTIDHHKSPLRRESGLEDKDERRGSMDGLESEYFGLSHHWFGERHGGHASDGLCFNDMDRRDEEKGQEVNGQGMPLQDRAATSMLAQSLSQIRMEDADQDSPRDEPPVVEGRRLSNSATVPRLPVFDTTERMTLSVAVARQRTQSAQLVPTTSHTIIPYYRKSSNLHRSHIAGSIDSMSTLSSSQQSHESSSFSHQSLSPPSHTTSNSMTLFHVVFVLRRGSNVNVSFAAQADDLYKNVVVNLMSAMKYEQMRCDFVRKEAEAMLRARETHATHGLASIPTTNHILANSQLARSLRDLFHGLTQQGMAHIILNDVIDLSMQMVTALDGLDGDGVGAEAGWRSWIGEQDMLNKRDRPRPSVLQAPEYSFAAHDAGFPSNFSPPILQPYHSLLLLQDPEELLNSIPLDSNPTLVQLVQIITPTVSLQDLQIPLDCSLSQVFRLASHLLYWRKAKLIYTISITNTYAIHPRAPMHLLPQLRREFQKDLPQCDLIQLLASLREPIPLAAIVPSRESRQLYLEAVTILLRRGFVVQLHSYLVLLVPIHVLEDDSQNGTANGTSYNATVRIDGEDRQGPGIKVLSTSLPNPDSLPLNGPPVRDGYTTFSNFDNASPKILPWIRSLAHQRLNREGTAMLERLLPYFNGKHAVEEICFREHVNRRELRTLLSRFREELVSFVRY